MQLFCRPANLQKSSIIVLSESVYYFGFLQAQKNVEFHCFRYNAELVVLDSFNINLGVGKPDEFYEIGIDTLNRFLNFCFQKVEKNNTGIYLRLTSKLKQIYFNDKAELTRINTQFIYDNDVIYLKNKVFVIRSPRDSVQKFFLSCYQLKSDTSFFDYQLMWGFRFYKFNYLRCKLLLADDEKVLVYVHALDGEKKGQYILSISSKTGELLTSVIFNEEEAIVPVSYFYSAHAYDPKTKEYLFAGLVAKVGEESTLLHTKKPPMLFFVVLNQNVELKYRINDVAALPPQAFKTKDLKFITVRINNIKALENESFQIISEVCGSKDGKLFKTCGFWLVSFNYVNGVRNLLTNEYFDLIGQKENKLVSNDLKDLNGIVQISNNLEYDKTLYLKQANNLIISAKAEGKSLVMLVVRRELSTKKIIYYKLAYIESKMKLDRIFDSTFDEMPICRAVNEINAVIFAKSIKEGLILNKILW